MQTLRFITCGSVDDGKSTLIGRLLFESGQVFEDQMAAVAADSGRYGTQGAQPDLALLVDGLQAEREQGITIDVAYRYFASAQRRYIVADTPGHEQYTRNMATGASSADLALLLVDARKGLLTQTRRHSRIVAMMGIRHVLLAVNKMDLVGFEQAAFEAIAADYRSFADALNFKSVQAIPVVALHGDNLLRASARMPWYQGPSLMACLDGMHVEPDAPGAAFRMPVQWVNRPGPDFRGLCGRVAKGGVRVGDAVRVLPSGVQTRVQAILSGFAEVQQARMGDAVTLTLADPVDAGRGDVLVAAEAPPEVADQFEARLLWMAQQPLLPGRQYSIKLACKEATASITEIKYREDVNSGARLAARTLGLNEIALVTLTVSAPLVFEPYAVNRTLGGFILIDKQSGDTVAAGMVVFALRRASNIHWQALELNQAARAAHKQQSARCIWFTGLSGSGKSTIANLLDKRLHALGRHTYVLDGDNVRHGLNRDLGFTEADRVENIRRVAEVAALMVDAGLVVIVSLISPFSADRAMARGLFGKGRFLEVFVDTPLQECERRDAKGLYAKARRGDLRNFTGIDSPYQAPASAEVHLLAGRDGPEACVEQILQALETLAAG